MFFDDGQAEVGLTAANILLTGGNMNMPQIEQRMLVEVRPLVSDIFSVQVCSLALSIFIILMSNLHICDWDYLYLY